VVVPLVRGEEQVGQGHEGLLRHKPVLLGVQVLDHGGDPALGEPRRGGDEGADELEHGLDHIGGDALVTFYLRVLAGGRRGGREQEGEGTLETERPVAFPLLLQGLVPLGVLCECDKGGDG